MNTIRIRIPLIQELNHKSFICRLMITKLLTVEREWARRGVFEGKKRTTYLTRRSANERWTWGRRRFARRTFLYIDKDLFAIILLIIFLWWCKQKMIEMVMITTTTPFDFSSSSFGRFRLLGNVYVVYDKEKSLVVVGECLTVWWWWWAVKDYYE